MSENNSWVTQEMIGQSDIGFSKKRFSIWLVVIVEWNDNENQAMEASSSRARIMLLFPFVAEQLYVCAFF